mmetsp:Transcript_10888/g.25239  ORF Transcript_10888/g.25239 Transcript_10888/m.25239 type:complete len:231 (-) Transcript_10888:665-1357(-)
MGRSTLMVGFVTMKTEERTSTSRQTTLPTCESFVAVVINRDTARGEGTKENRARSVQTDPTLSGMDVSKLCSLLPRFSQDVCIVPPTMCRFDKGYSSPPRTCSVTLEAGHPSVNKDIFPCTVYPLSFNTSMSQLITSVMTRVADCLFSSWTDSSTVARFGVFEQLGRRGRYQECFGRVVAPTFLVALWVGEGGFLTCIIFFPSTNSGSILVMGKSIPSLSKLSRISCTCS